MNAIIRTMMNIYIYYKIITYVFINLTGSIQNATYAERKILNGIKRF